jgi:peptide-methionine (R)-S-oxide reductase
MSDKVIKSNEAWRAQLTPDEYRVARERGTERAFTGRYVNHHEDGTYTCVGCGAALFDAATKFESGSGWPSYFAPVSPEIVETETDRTLGMNRVEVHCARCGSHLGHVFPDGPKPTGLRYCVNSLSLGFQPKKK